VNIHVCMCIYTYTFMYVHINIHVYVHIYIYICIDMYSNVCAHIFKCIYIYVHICRCRSFVLCCAALPPMCFSVKRSRLQVSFLYCSCSLSFCVAQVFFILCSKVSSYHLLHEKSPIRSPINLNPLNRNLFSQKNPIFNFHLKFLFLCSEVSFIISYMKRARFSLQ